MKSAIYTRRIKNSREIVGVSTVTFGNKNEPTPMLMTMPCRHRCGCEWLVYRSVPDVAFNADPEYGAQIYTSVLGGWVVVGGTSVSTAFFTGVVAMVNSARKDQNLRLLTSVTDQGVTLQDSLYKLMSTNGGPTKFTVLNDVVDGTAGDGLLSGQLTRQGSKGSDSRSSSAR